ncbi:hypothetical protein EJB05_31011 [Eragrostis curvula]|uniref:Cytochrome P450 90D2 n=1 Tax=Eragrostis curvula TaxID=38414 RepID=A0A5J9UDP2_9POAL|nr:hypothetical protein EJB05_31011 [Eragrostis curvula]
MSAANTAFSWPSPASMAGIALPLLLFVVVAAALWTLASRSRWLLTRGRGGKGSTARLPPGSFGWPVVGETLDFVSCAYSPRPESFIEKRRRRHGGGAVFVSHLFGSATVVTSDAEVSRAVLQSDARSFVPWYPRSLTELMGESSILLINGALQRRVHGLVGAFFKSPRLKAQVTADMQRLLAPALAEWRERGPGARLRIQDHAKTIVFQILVRGLIGLEAGPEMQQLKLQFQEFIVGLMSLPIKLPGTRLYRSLQAKKRMAKLIQGIIQEKRKRRILGGDGQRDPPRDTIDVLISGESDELTDELISDNMIDLMIPAEDSVPVLITLAIKYLSECPLALQQLEVITETLRMGNIISGIMRKAVRDVEVKGHLIPKGWCVFVYFRSVHLDDTLYNEPYKFNPWRWKGLHEWGCGTLDMWVYSYKGEGHEHQQLHSFRRWAEAVPRPGSGQAGSLHLPPSLGHQLQLSSSYQAWIDTSIVCELRLGSSDLLMLVQADEMQYIARSKPQRQGTPTLHRLVMEAGYFGPIVPWVAEEDHIVNFPTVRLKRGMPIRVTSKD